MAPSAQSPCQSQLCGVWRQDASRCESLCPLLEGLGLPPALLWAACPIADRVHTTLKISCPEAGRVEIVDKTVFGRNVTSVRTDGSEEEHFSRTKRKPFMLSATAADDASVTLNCRLVSRGPGWHTRQERELGENGRTLVERHVLVRPGHEDVVVERMFNRVPGEDLRPDAAS
jgi:hypothetical protein